MDNPEYFKTDYVYKRGRPAHINPYSISNKTTIPAHVYENQCKHYQYEVSLKEAADKLIKEKLKDVKFSNKVEKNQFLFNIATMLQESFPKARDAELARAVGLSRATFCNYRRGKHSAKKKEEQAELIDAIRKIFVESGGTYGKKRIAIALREKFNMDYCVVTVAKYMKLANVKVVPRKSVKNSNKVC